MFNTPPRSKNNVAYEISVMGDQNGSFIHQVVPKPASIGKPIKLLKQSRRQILILQFKCCYSCRIKNNVLTLQHTLPDFQRNTELYSERQHILADFSKNNSVFR